jgi:hypothetical protein
MHGDDDFKREQTLLEYDFDLFPGACTLVGRGNLASGHLPPTTSNHLPQCVRGGHSSRSWSQVTSFRRSVPRRLADEV